MTPELFERLKGDVYKQVSELVTGDPLTPQTGEAAAADLQGQLRAHAKQLITDYYTPEAAYLWPPPKDDPTV